MAGEKPIREQKMRAPAVLGKEQSVRACAYQKASQSSRRARRENSQIIFLPGPPVKKYFSACKCARRARAASRNPLKQVASPLF
jgi:hypothetical protein